MPKYKNPNQEQLLLIPKMIKNADEVMKYSINSKKLSPYEINEIIRSSYKMDYKNESLKMIGEDILSAISKMKNKAIREGRQKENDYNNFRFEGREKNIKRGNKKKVPTL